MVRVPCRFFYPHLQLRTRAPPPARALLVDGQRWRASARCGCCKRTRPWLRGLSCATRAAQRSHLAPLLICSARLQRQAELVRY